MSKKNWNLRDYLRGVQELLRELSGNVADANHALEELEIAIEDQIEADQSTESWPDCSVQDRALTGEAFASLQAQGFSVRPASCDPTDSVRQ